MIVDIAHALVALAPEKRWRVIEGTLHWEDKSPQPSDEAIQAKIVELQADYDSKQYQRDRAEQYPSIQEQLDMQYWDAVNGTKKWQEAVAKVKTDNPKPE